MESQKVQKFMESKRREETENEYNIFVLTLKAKGNFKYITFDPRKVFNYISRKKDMRM